MRPFDIDDKDLVIVGVVVICCIAIFKIPNAAPDLIEKAFYGLFGIATGYALNEVKRLRQEKKAKKKVPPPEGRGDKEEVVL